MHSKTFQDISRHFETNASVRTVRSSRRSTDSRFDRRRHLTPRLSHALPPTHLPGWSVRRFLRCLEFGTISRHFETLEPGSRRYDFPHGLINTNLSYTHLMHALSIWFDFYRGVCYYSDFISAQISRHFETFRGS